MFKLLVLSLVLNLSFLCWQVFSTESQSQPPISGDFSAPCNETVGCKNFSGLTCNPNLKKCECAKPNDVVYSVERRECVARLGRACGRSHRPRDPNSDWHWIPPICEKNFTCGSYNICECPKGFYEDIEANKCFPFKDHGAECQTQVECNFIKGIFCQNWTCQCFAPNDTEYDSTHDSYHTFCKVKLGHDCKNLPKRLRNSNLTISVFPEKVDKSRPDVMLKLRIYEELRGRTFAITKCGRELFCNPVSEVCSCSFDTFLNDSTSRCDPKKGLHQSCSSLEECNHRKKLACINGTCQCFAPAEMVEQEGGVCKIQFGKNCADLHNHYKNTTRMIPMFLGRAADFDDRLVNWTLEGIIRTYSHSPCTGEFVCNEKTNVCSCRSNHFFNVKAQLCQQHKEMGEICSSEQDCNHVDKLLTCVKGKCDCDLKISMKNYKTFKVRDPRMYFEEKTMTVPIGICVGKVGTSCFQVLETTGSRPYYWQGSVIGPHPRNTYCMKDFECRDGSCQCKANLYPTMDKMCGRGYNEDCSIEKPCVDYLVCRTVPTSSPMKCRCRNEKYQVYVQTTTAEEGCMGRCQNVELVGAKCNPTGPVLCAKHSECVPKEENTLLGSSSGGHICKCKSGFLGNADKLCDIAHDQPCNYATQEERCDSLANLECGIVRKNNENNDSSLVRVCSCLNLDDVYDAKDRKCKTPSFEQKCSDNVNSTTAGVCLREDFVIIQQGLSTCTSRLDGPVTTPSPPVDDDDDDDD